MAPMLELWNAATASPHSALLHLNAILCTVAFAGLLWRLIGRWPLSYPLARIIVVLFAALELIVALGTARRAALDAPFNEAQYAILLHAVVTLFVVVVWPRLLNERTPA